MNTCPQPFPQKKVAKRLMGPTKYENTSSKTFRIITGHIKPVKNFNLHWKFNSARRDVQKLAEVVQK